MMVPAAVSVVLVLVGALPSVVSGYDVFPNMAVLLCCFFVLHYPTAWPLWFAFLLGLLQDIVSGTALGAQAIVLMLTCVLVARHSRHVNRQNFRMLMIEIAVVSALYMGALWLLMSWVMYGWLPLWPVVKEIVCTVAFYPLIHLLLIPILRLLPPLR